MRRTVIPTEIIKCSIRRIYSFILDNRSENAKKIFTNVSSLLGIVDQQIYIGKYNEQNECQLLNRMSRD